MDSPTAAYAYLFFVWLIVPTLITFFISFLCREMGIPVWCPWVVLAAYTFKSQSKIIYFCNNPPPEDYGVNGEIK